MITNEKRLQTEIKKFCENKYLQEKYLKNAFVQVAHYQSITANQNLPCKICGQNGSVCTIRSKRKGTWKSFYNNSEIHYGYICHDCIQKIGEHLKHKFKFDYCP